MNHSLLCAYPVDALGGAAFEAVFGDVCAEHTLVIPAESYTALETADAHLREIARLQQRAASLEAEVVERERVEMAALRLAAIVESSDDAIIGKTIEGIITDWNCGAERLYGYAAAEVIGRPISVLRSRKAHDSGVQPRAPGMSSHPGSSGSPGLPVRG